MSLDHAVRGLLHGALQVYADSPRAVSWLHQHERRLDEPVRVAVAGAPASGKSTLVNALIGERIAPVGDRVFTWYRAGSTPRAIAFLPSGGANELPVGRHADGAHVEVGSWLLDRVEVQWPTRALRDLTLVDTPGDAPLARIFADADAVLYLMRNRQGRELPLLRSAFEHPIAAATPVNTIAVLSRIDEVGAGRIDALSSGKRLARRYRRDLEVRSVCQDVVAVAGLVAQAGRTLAEPDFAAMAALANLPRAEVADALLSADRFVGAALPSGEPRSDTRQALLDRFGIFGVRLITTLIRTGFDDPARLQAELVQRSGLGELRESMRQYFVERRDVLKARSALLAVDTVLRTEPRPAAGQLVADLERVLASAHDFDELRLLSSLHAGRAQLPDDLDAEARRIIGGHGTGMADRLGVDHEPTAAELRHLVLDALERWQERAASPTGAAEARRAARVVVRSCEGMLAALYDGALDSRS